MKLRASAIRAFKAEYFDPWGMKRLGSLSGSFDPRRIRLLRQDIKDDLDFHSRRCGVRRAKLRLTFYPFLTN